MVTVMGLVYLRLHHAGSTTKEPQGCLPSLHCHFSSSYIPDCRGRRTWKLRANSSFFTSKVLVLARSSSGVAYLCTEI